MLCSWLMPIQRLSSPAVLRGLISLKVWASVIFNLVSQKDYFFQCCEIFSSHWPVVAQTLDLYCNAAFFWFHSASLIGPLPCGPSQHDVSRLDSGGLPCLWRGRVPEADWAGQDWRVVHRHQANGLELHQNASNFANPESCSEETGHHTFRCSRAVSKGKEHEEAIDLCGVGCLWSWRMAAEQLCNLQAADAWESCADHCH